MTDLDDLLGETAPAVPEPPKRRRGRPTNAERAARLAAEAEQAKSGLIELPDTSMFYRPVGVTFLAKVFRMEAKTVMKRLMKCPVVDHEMVRGKMHPRWDFKEAASYLVDPKVDLVQYLSSLNSNNIPPHINKTFWDAMNAKAKWQANARQTWRDEDVLEVLGETAISIRETTMLWVDELPDKASITDENYKAIRAAVNDLLEQIKIKLVEMPKKRRTESMVATMEAELGEAQTEDTALPEDFDDLLGDDED